MKRGGEVEFVWKGKSYSITHVDNDKISFSQARKQETEVLCDNADEILGIVIDGNTLRSIITQIIVTARTI